MSNSDGKVRIIIDTNAKEAQKQLDDVTKAFNKNAEVVNSASTAYSGYEKAIQENITLLREMALGGQHNTESFKKVADRTKEYKKALDEANNAVDKATGGINAQGGIFDQLKGKITGLIGAYVGIRGAVAAFNYVMSSVEAYRTQEVAINSLNNTLQNAGVYSIQYSQQIQTLASEIQSYSNYGDEAVIKAQALGQSFAGQIPITEKATKAVVDFAAATGMDLEQAFTLFGKSVGSSTNALGRYGVELQKGMSDSQKMAAIVKQLGDRYDGSAKQMSNATVQMQNALGDLSESFGSLFNQIITDNQKTITNFINGWINAIDYLRVKISNIQNMSVIDAQQRIRQIYVEQEKIQNRFINGSATTRDAARLEQLKNEENQALLRIKQLTDREKEIIKNQKPIKFNDDIGFSSSVSTGSSRGINGGSAAQKAKDDYEKLQIAAAAAKREIELAAIAHGTSSVEVQNAFTKYQQLNGQLQEISALFSNQSMNTESANSAYQVLTDKVTTLTAKLRDLAAEQKIGTDEWVQYKSELTAAQAELDNVNQSLTDSGIKIEETSKRISSSISSGIINLIKNGGDAFDMFSNIATTALQKVLDKLIEMAIVTPVLNAFTGGVGGSLFSFLGFKDGAAFKNGNVIPFARGGVVNKPTLFPMANGGTGLMGEAGAEAVMPLRRMANGRLGVEAEGNNGNAVNVNIYNQAGASVETRKRDDGSMDIFIKKVNEALSSERTSNGFRSAYAREDKRGVQAV